MDLLYPKETYGKRVVPASLPLRKLYNWLKLPGFIFLLFFNIKSEAQSTPVNGITTFNTIAIGTYQEYGRTSDASTGLKAENIANSGWDIAGYTSGSDDYVLAGQNWGDVSDGGLIYLASVNRHSYITSLSFKTHEGKIFDLSSIDLGYDVAGAATTMLTITGYKNGVLINGASYSVPIFPSFASNIYWNRSIAIPNANFRGIDEFRITPNSSNVLTALNIDNINATNFHSDSKSFSTLPVNWISFTGNKQGKQVALDWKTSAEENTKNFIVQHSTNGQNWNNVGSVTAAGNSTTVQSYSFLHNNPVSGLNYYRLRQQDIDGKENYSKIITVNLGDVQQDLNVFPNPTKGRVINIKLPNASLVQLYNSQGILVWQKSLAAGIHLLTLEKLTRGIYILKAYSQSAPVVLE